MKRFNKLLMYASSSTLLLPITLLVACTPSKVVSKPIDDNEFSKLINSIKTEDDLLKYADIKFKDQRGSEISKGNILPSQLKKENISIIFKGKYIGQISTEVLNVNVINQDSSLGNKVNIFVQFTNKKTGTKIPTSFIISGLNENGNFDFSGTRIVNDLDYFGGLSGFNDYSNKTQEQRFDYDNSRYITGLKNHLSSGTGTVDLKKLRGLDTKEEQIRTFDKLAKEVKFDSYYNAALKGFTLPVYDNSGQFIGLSVNDEQEIGKIASHVDSLGRTEKAKTNGLARTIPNDTYRTAAIQTYQVNFTIYKDYAKEIEEAEDNIQLFNKWDEKQIQSYISAQLNQLRLNFEDEVSQIEKQLSQPLDGRTTIVENLNKRKSEITTEYEKKLKEISSLNRDNLVEWQKKEIEEYKKKREEKIFRTSESGTMWIMDYIDINNPTKFYFGTNSHVAKGIRDDMISFSLTRLNSNIKVGQTFGLNSADKNFTKFTFEPAKKEKKLNEAVTAIFHATDFIKKESSPLSLLKDDQKTKYSEAGLFADFAVVEIDFEKLLDTNNFSRTIWSDSSDISSKYQDDKNELIKKITNDYAKSDKKISFASESILDDKNYKKFDRKLDFNPENSDELKAYRDLDSLYIVGYPTSNEDYYLDQYEDEKQLKNKKYDFSLWINNEYKYYKKLVNGEGTSSSFKDYELEKGNFFSYQIGYRSFIDKPGLTDAFLAANKVGKKLYSLDEQNKGKAKKYFNYGLEILPRFYAPAGGASGSSVRTKDNKLLAVYHAANGWAKTGLAAVFRSNGYDYKNLFGPYKLGQYDLIYGGGKDQEKGKSYREALLKKYNNDIKSALFPNGFSDDKVPQQFKFDNGKQK
ncbi:prolipoprotein [Mycoplasma mycoides subsp. mycoides]|uniref:Ig-specific serine endopeptidase MIP n=1 Tax=Mycoplasma mycoides TaxID=2102 RepID=UPI000767FE94|nr:DUF31 family protein [Mycoplasma mycoides]AME10831.1 prolipoprotein [Mycoplasma mycoides subsp. mycoides]AME11839.1 prolipoprotein [Mycoplasma mycoides subsp. mycoides]AME12869.1 prolipoprotein [Mycoplasma mycoides subsp. mycoides]AME13893.1 prolipoprotein [Mycoplasma mycoides subsp. mycoides]